MRGRADGTIHIDTKIDEKGFRGGIGRLKKFGAAAALAIGVAVAAALVKGTRDFVEFEGKMNEVFTLMPDISGEAMDEMTQQVKDFSKEFGTLPNEVVPALYQAISAGVPKENVFDFLEVAQKAAIGGVTELETAVDGISSAVNAYGEDVLGATEASDLMFTAVRLGKTDFEQLSSFLFQVIPTASALGVEFGDVTAAVAALTAQGVPTRVATTQMRQAFVELSKDGSKTSDIFQEISGKTFKDFIAEGGNTSEALNLMADYAADAGIGVNDLFGSVEAGAAALSLTGEGAEAFAANIAEMEGAAGATDEAFETMEQGIGRSWDKIKASAAVALLDIGEAVAPAVAKISDALEGIDFSAVIATIVEGVGTVKEWLSPVGDAIKTISEFVGGLWESFEPLRETFAETAATMREDFGPAIESIKQAWEDMAPAREALLAGLKLIGQIIGTVVVVAIGLFIGIINGLMRAIGPLIQAVMSIASIFGNVFKLIKGIVTLDGEAIKEAVGGIIDGIVGFFSGLWGAVKGYIEGFIDGTVSFFTGLYDALVGGSIIPDMINDIVDWLKGLPAKAVSALAQLLPLLARVALTAMARFRAAIISGANTVVTWMRGLPRRLVSAVGNLSRALASAGGQLIAGLWNGIRDKAAWLKNRIRSFVSDVTSFLKNLFGISSPSKLFEKEIGLNLALGLGKGFTGGLDKVMSDMSSTVSGEIARFSGALSAGGGTVYGGLTVHVDARGASDPMAVQAAGHRGVFEALEEAVRLGRLSEGLMKP